jgi:KaiC/GvpD/RAD55 family RecA-like ATPase
MNDILAFGKLVESFISKMTSPEIGQFRLEVSTFRIILERARVETTKLVKFTITDNGEVVNNLKDDEESMEALSIYLQKSLDFISSLIGEELARDIIISSMKEEIKRLSPKIKGRDDLLEHIPEPFKTMLVMAMENKGGGSDHEQLLDLFNDIFHDYLKDLSTHTDLSAFKLKLSIMREKYELLKYVELTRDHSIKIDKQEWTNATAEEIRTALSALFNSMVGLSTFLLGKEEAVKKASRTFQYYFEGKEELIDRYGLSEEILDGALHKKISTGIEVLDRKMGGGIPKGASILLISPSGIERDMFISGLLNKGLNNGSSAMMVLSKEPPRSIRMLLRSNGLDSEELEESGRFRIVDWFSWRGERIIGVERDGHSLKSSKILSNLGIAINKGLRELTYSTNKIGIIHIIGPATNIFEFNQVYNFVQRLRAKFKDDEMASIFLLEKDSLSRELESRILEIFDGTLEINKEMVEGHFQREMVIRSLSGVDFDANPLKFKIKDNMIIPEAQGQENLPPTVPISPKLKNRSVRSEPSGKQVIPPLNHDLVARLPELEDVEEEKEVVEKTPKPSPKLKRKVKRKIQEHPKGSNPDLQERREKPREIPTPAAPPIRRVKPVKKKVVRRGSSNGSGEKTIDPEMEGMDLGLANGDHMDILTEAMNNIDELLEEEDISDEEDNKKKLK